MGFGGLLTFTKDSGGLVRTTLGTGEVTGPIEGIVTVGKIYEKGRGRDGWGRVADVVDCAMEQLVSLLVADVAETVVNGETIGWCFTYLCYYWTYWNLDAEFIDCCMII